jgi:hypothetical protein
MTSDRVKDQYAKFGRPPPDEEDPAATLQPEAPLVVSAEHDDKMRAAADMAVNCQSLPCRSTHCFKNEYDKWECLCGRSEN